jgi:hypothetical protein
MIHNVSYRTFVYGTEDEEKVVSALNHIFPSVLPKRDVNEDSYGNKIIVLTNKVTKKRMIKDIVSFLNENLSDKDKATIKKELNRRVDEKGNLFLRFDKQAAYDKTLKLSYSGDVIHVRIKIASYPVSKENALKVAHEFFNFI